MKKSQATMAVFVLMNFVLSMTGVVFTGILDQVALQLQMSVAKTSLLNSMYSYGAAIGLPITLIVLRKIERVRLMKAMLAATMITSILLIITRDFTQLLIIRVLMGIVANSYGVLAIVVFMAQSSQQRAGRNLALFIMGNSLSLVIGVPLTRLLSPVLDWRGFFLVLSALMAFSLVYFHLNLPKVYARDTELNLQSEFALLRKRRIALLLLFALIMYAGHGAFYNFITPYLLDLSNTLSPYMSLILLLLGLSSLFGNWLGGQVTDRIGYADTMKLGASMQFTLVLLLLLTRAYPVFNAALVIVYMMSTWFTGLQLNLGMNLETENKSRFMMSMVSVAIQLGYSIGTSLSYAVAQAFSVRNILHITLITTCTITLLVWAQQKKPRGLANPQG
ncbi:MAG: MFS transporter [Clostridiales bacterium]|nr:MFS transporter [Clostridiales bacterium]